MATESIVYGKTSFSFEKLSFDNYKDWEFNMTMLLRKEGVWKVFQDEIKQILLEDGTSYRYPAEAEEKSEKALSLIAMSVDKAQRVHLKGADTPGEAWLALRNAFKNKGSEDPTVLKMKFNRIFMRDGSNVKDHLNTLMELKTSLDQTEFRVTDGDFVLRILDSLPSAYDSYVISLRCLPNKAMLTPRFVMDNLLEEVDRRERRKQLTEETESNNGAVAFQTSSKTAVEKGKFHGECFYCKKKGHMKKDCHKFKKDNKDKGTSSQANTAKQEDNGSPVVGLQCSTEGCNIAC